MKILHLIDSGGLYGAEVMLLDLAQEQQRLGLEPIIASIGTARPGQKPLEAEARRRSIPVETFRMRPGPNLAGALAILRFAQRQGVDLLHAHGYKANILFGLMPRPLRRLPLVSTVHGWTSTSGWSRMRLYEWLDGLSLRGADQIVLVNSAMAAHPRLLPLGQRCRVVDNGIAPSSGSALSPEDELAAFCRQGFTLCAIGRLSPEKGFDVLLSALANLTPQYPDLRLVLFGEGGQRPVLEQQIQRLGLQRRVRLPGYCATVRSYLPLCRALVLSSLTEGLPIVVLEAMQAKVPIIASAVGGVPEVLAQGQAGLLVPAGDVAALTAAIDQLLTEPDAATTRVAEAWRRVCEHYSSGAMARKYQTVYAGVLA